jgi:4-hydroxy-tetrahydrodipicolinate synthase
MVTPVSSTGALDEDAARRIIDFLLEGRVEGVFVLGTTGEAASVPRAVRLRLVELTVRHVAGRAMVYAGLNDNSLADGLEAGNAYLRCGADALVALLPSYFPVQPPEMLDYFQRLLDGVQGPVLLYNIPATTRLSIPLEVLERLVGHPRLIGLKDSENDAARHEAIQKQFGGRSGFSFFIGVGTLMARMVLLGADGIVPSMANLAPDWCQELFERARVGDRSSLESLEKRMLAAATLYQRGRTLGQSLAALKAAMSALGLCQRNMLPPLVTLAEAECEPIRQEMAALGLLK